MYWSTASSISHVFGVGPSVKSEKVRWYVGAYRTDRVVRFERLSMADGVSVWDREPEDMDDVESRYEMIDCSSAKVSRSCVAMYVANVEEPEFGGDIALGGYVTCNEAE